MPDDATVPAPNPEPVASDDPQSTESLEHDDDLPVPHDQQPGEPGGPIDPAQVPGFDRLPQPEGGHAPDLVDDGGPTQEGEDTPSEDMPGM